MIVLVCVLSCNDLQEVGQTILKIDEATEDDNITYRIVEVDDGECNEKG